MHRALPVGNKILYARMKEREQKKHKNRLSTMTSSFNTTTTKNNTSIASTNMKGHYYKRERLLQVDRDNQLLLRRMNTIARRTNQFRSSSSSSSSSTNVSPKHVSKIPSQKTTTTMMATKSSEYSTRASKHLEHYARKRELEIQKIESENYRMAQRLEAARGTYSVTRARQEWSLNRNYLENACNYPVNIELFGQRDGSMSPRSSRSRAPKRPSTTEPTHRPSRKSNRGPSGRAGRNVVTRQEVLHRRRPNTTQYDANKNTDNGDLYHRRLRPTNSSASRRFRPPPSSELAHFQNMKIHSPAVAAVMENINDRDVQSFVAGSAAPSVTWTSDDVRIGTEMFTVCGFSLGLEHGGVLFEARSRSLSVVYRLTASGTDVTRALLTMRKHTCLQSLHNNTMDEKGTTEGASSNSATEENNGHPHTIEMLARNCLRFRLVKRRLRLVLSPPKLTEEQRDTQDAVLKIQSRTRGMLQRRQSRQEHLSAKIVQRNQRGRMARKNVMAKRIQFQEEKVAATQLQARQRGRRGRKKSIAKRTEMKAVKRIQSTERGRQARVRTDAMKEKRAQVEKERQRLKVEERQSRHRRLIERRQLRESGELSYSMNTSPDKVASPKQEITTSEKHNIRVLSEQEINTASEEVTDAEMGTAVQEMASAWEEMATVGEEMAAGSETIAGGVKGMTFNNETAEETPNETRTKDVEIEEEKEEEKKEEEMEIVALDLNNSSDDEVEEEHEAVVDLFEGSYVFDTNLPAYTRDREEIIVTDNIKKEDKKEEIYEVVKDHEAVLDMFEGSYVFDDSTEKTFSNLIKEPVKNILNSTVVSENQEKETKSDAQITEMMTLQDPDVSHVESMFEESYIFTEDVPSLTDEKCVQEQPAQKITQKKGRSQSEVDDDSVTISELLARSQGDGTTRTEPAAIGATTAVSELATITDSKNQVPTSAKTMLRITKGITIVAEDTLEQMHLLVTLAILNDSGEQRVQLRVYDPSTSTQHISMFFHESDARILLKLTSASDMSKLSDALGRLVLTCAEGTVSVASLGMEEASNNTIECDKTDEYHIDVSQLDEKGLQAIRANLDELFSEFDTRGKGRFLNSFANCF